MVKLCAGCNSEKPADQFYRNSGHKDGLSSWCKVCTQADMHRRWRDRHPEPAPWVMPTEKACTKCGEVKPLDQFHKRSSARDGRQPQCATCATAAVIEHNQRNPKDHAKRVREYYRKHPERKADSHLKWRLGLPYGTYDQMIAAQGGVCAICGTDEPGGNAKNRFHMDHDEATGKVRGLLCTSCNNGIGRFSHDPDRIRKAIDYLNKHA